MPVSVYKTNIDDSSEASTIVTEIRRVLPGSDPSFDLEDCDKVLRVEYQSSNMDKTKVESILEDYGYQISPLL